MGEGVNRVLRVTAIVAVIGTAIGVVVAPGLHGNASEATVVRWDRVASIGSTFMFVLLSGMAIFGSYTLSRADRVPVAPKVVMLLGAFVSLVLATPALQHKLPSLFAAVLAMATNVTALVAGVFAMRLAVTRGAGIVVLLLAVSASTRLFGWELAVIAGERASLSLYDVSRGFATAAVVSEALALLGASVWVSSRSRLFGQLPASLALGVAFLATWAVAKGKPTEATLWEWMLLTSLGPVPVVPAPFVVGTLQTLLACSSITLGLVLALQPRIATALVAPLALAVLARGETAVPLRALALVTGSLWLAIATGDLTPARATPPPAGRRPEPLRSFTDA
ncbi:MAG: hypothetical protein U0169_15160 [Polyangiaceae bacterium]